MTNVMSNLHGSIVARRDSSEFCLSKETVPALLSSLIEEPVASIEALDSLDYATVQHALVLARDASLGIPELEPALQILGEYSDMRLARKKEEMGLHSIYEVSSGDGALFSKRPVLYHESFGWVSLIEAYSLAKFGDPIAVAYCAECFANDVLAVIDEAELREGHWGIAAPRFDLADTAASLIASTAAELLHLPFIPICTSSFATSWHAKMQTVEERHRNNQQTKYKTPEYVTRNVLLFDDCIVSCSSMELFITTLKRASTVQKVLPWALVNVASSELTLEQMLNDGVISHENPHGLVDVLNHPDTRVVTRAVKGLISADSAFVQTVAMAVRPEMLRIIHTIAEESTLGYQPTMVDGFNELKTVMRKRGILV